MSYDENSDQQANDYTENDESLNEGVASQESDESESSGSEGERGARKAEDSNFVDFEKIPDPVEKQKFKARVAELYRGTIEGKKAKAEAQQLREELASLRSEKSLKEVEAPSIDLAIDDPRKFAEQQQAHANYLAEKRAVEVAKQAKAEQVAEAQKQAENERIASYNKRVKESKVDTELLTSAAQQVASAGIGVDLANYLLEHEHGPSLVLALGTDFETLYKVSQMSPLKAVEYIQSVVAPKALQTKKPSAPPPPTKANGARITGDSSVGGWSIR